LAVVTNEEILAYTTRLLGETREEVGRADAKAATLLSASAIAVTLLVGLYELRGHPLRVLPVWRADLVLFAFAVSGIGVVLLGLAVLPRATSVAKDRVPPYFFGEVARYGRNEERLMTDLAQAPQQVTERTVSQLLVVSQIVVRKYRYVRYGLLGLFAGGLLAIVATYPIWRLR
jgi:hypothetical protein